MSTKWLWACAIVSIAAVVAPLSAAQPLVYYSFDTLGAKVADQSGNGHDGTVNGGVTLSDDGYAGKSFSFNGSDAYVQLDRPIQDDFTISAWIKTSVNGATGSYAYQGSGLAWSDVAGTANDFVMAVLGTKLSFFGGNPDTSVSSNADIVTGEWVYITAVRNTGNQTLSVYVNGQFDNSVSYSNASALNACDVLAIGANTLDSRYYNGLIDEVKLFGEALSSAEIYQIYGVPVAGNPNPADGAAGVTAAGLQWDAGLGAAFHNVYLGAAPELTAADLVGEKQTDALYWFPADLPPNTTYYWRVDEVEADGTTVHAGNVWSFTTIPLTTWAPSPADGARRVLLSATLSWNAGKDAVYYSVYFGTDHDAVAQGAAETLLIEVADPACEPTALAAGTTYFWRVDQMDMTGTFHTGDVWSFSTVPNVPITDAHLVGWWTFDEDEGTIAVDSSGYNHHGILYGSIERTEGYFGGALEFGADRYVDCGDAALNVTGDFTLATWVRLDPGNAGVYGGIGGKLYYDGANYFGFGLVRHSGNAFRLWVGDGTADLAKSAVSSDVTYTDTDWHHVAGVHSGLANTLYVDGVKQGATTNISFVPSSQFFHIGRQYSSQTDRTFPGLIDEVRVYDKASTDAEIATIMLGNTKLAGSPSPINGFEVDIRNISELSWSAGTSAVSHDVYLGTDRGAVADADHSSPEFKGNQTGTTFSVADVVAFGSGAFYWRIDEVAADGTVYTGYVWSFSVPAYLIVDNFESYTNDQDAEEAIFNAWVDGLTDNLSTSVVGHEAVPFAEQAIVQSGLQAMPFYYKNADSPYFAEAVYTFDGTQDWTAEGVTTLTLAVRGKADNVASTLYVALADSSKTGVVQNADTSLLTTETWTTWTIPLSEFGVKTTAIKKMYIGVGDRANPTPGGAGLVYIDDIRLVK